MSKQKLPAWGNRRWKLFEKAYSDDKQFKSRIDDIAKEKDDLKKIGHVATALEDNNLPIDLLSAVNEFINNQNLEREHYINFIPPPAQFWSTSINRTGPSVKRPTNNQSNDSKPTGTLTFTGVSDLNVITPDLSNTAEGYLNLILDSGNIEMIVNGSKIRGLELGNILSDGNLMLRVNPYTTKTELKSFIDECWDELAPLLESNSGHARFSEKLIGNIRRSKDDDEKKREQIIIKLTEAGESDLYIQTQLAKNGFNFVSVENIRQIRFRFKRKNSG